MAQRHPLSGGTTSVIQEPPRLWSATQTKTSPQSLSRRNGFDPRNLHGDHAGDSKARGDGLLICANLTEIITPSGQETTENNEVGPKTGPRAMVYNGTTHQACGGTVSRSRNNADTRQPSSPVSRWQRLQAPRQSGQYPVNTRFMPTRFEPENDTSSYEGPAPSSQHGPAQHLQPPRTHPTDPTTHQEKRQKKENPST